MAIKNCGHATRVSIKRKNCTRVTKTILVRVETVLIQVETVFAKGKIAKVLSGEYFNVENRTVNLDISFSSARFRMLDCEDYFTFRHFSVA